MNKFHACGNTHGNPKQSGAEKLYSDSWRLVSNPNERIKKLSKGHFY